MSNSGRISNMSSPCRKRVLYLCGLASLAAGALAALLWHLGGENVYHALLKGSFAGAGTLTGLIGLCDFYAKAAKQVDQGHNEKNE